MENSTAIPKGFISYGLAAFLIGIVGGFSSVLGPAFVADLGINYSNTTWTALAQAMSTAAWAPILGKLGDIMGKKVTLLLGLLVFTLGNALTAFAPSLGFMLVARFIVGLGTAAVAPVIIAYIAAEFPPAIVAKGFSLYMLISSSGVIFGPTFGNLVISAYGWRANAWLCVAICAAVLPICALLGEKARFQRKQLTDFDRVGTIFVVLFFSLLLCVPSFGQNFGWTSGPFIAVLLAAIPCLLGLIFAERQAVNPILPGSFIRRSVFLLSILALFLTQGLMQANMTNTIVFVSYTQPDNTLISGLAISVMYLGMALGAVILGPLSARFQPKNVLTCSLLLTGLGCALLFFFSEHTPGAILIAALGILGFGLGGNGTIFMETALSGLSPAEAGTGAGTYGLFRDLSAPFGVAVFVPLFTNHVTKQITVGASGGVAAVHAIHLLAIVEVLCVAAGIAVVRMLPRRKGE